MKRGQERSRRVINVEGILLGIQESVIASADVHIAYLGRLSTDKSRDR